MARQARLVNKIFLFYCFILLLTYEGCVSPPQIIRDKSVQTINYKSGLLIINNHPFTGTLYTLFPGTSDTATLENYQQGKEDGEWKKFYASKKIKETRYFKQGQKIGEYRVWWENGKQQLDYFFDKDEYQGTCQEWNEKGFLNKRMHYVKGHEQGREQWWYDNGKVKANYIILAGRRYGLLGTKNCINVSDSVFKK